MQIWLSTATTSVITLATMGIGKGVSKASESVAKSRLAQKYGEATIAELERSGLKTAQINSTIKSLEKQGISSSVINSIVRDGKEFSYFSKILNGSSNKALAIKFVNTYGDDGARAFVSYGDDVVNAFNSGKTLEEFIASNNSYTLSQLQEYAKSVGVTNIAGKEEQILKMCNNREDLCKRLLSAIPQSYGDEGLTLVQLVEKYKIPANPAEASLTTYETRIWYKWQESLIDSSLDYSKPLESVAHDAFNMRNSIRTQARLSMSDTNWSYRLFQSESNMTFDDILNKYYAEGYRGDDLWKIIIEKSQTSRDAVNTLFGLS